MGVFLPWFADGTGTHAGISEPDGVVVLVALFGAAVLAALRTRAAWVVAGLAASVAIRDLLRIDDHPVAEPRAGIWFTVAASAVAGLLLLRDVVAGLGRPN